MPELPNQRYVRRRHIRRCYGIDDEDITKLIAATVLKPCYLNGSGRAWFRRDEVIAAEEAGKIFKAEKMK